MKKIILLAFLLAIFLTTPALSFAQSTLPASSFTRSLSLGSTGADVTTLQNFLIAQKYLVMPAGAAKGTFGPLTRKAVMAWQKANGLTPVDGYFGPKSRAKATGVAVSAVASKSTPIKAAATISTNLDWRSSGKEVVTLQNFLKSKGYLTGSYTSGKFDSKTESALKRYSGKPYLTTATRTQINNALRGPVASKGSSASSAGGSNSNAAPTLAKTPAMAMNNDIAPILNTQSNVNIAKSVADTVKTSTVDKNIVANPTSESVAALTSPKVTASTVSASVNWSDPATWVKGKVPVAGDDVVIPAGKRVVIDTSTASIASLMVHGTIEVARKDTNITAGYIMVMGAGQFIVGSTDNPFANKLTITLTGTDKAATSCGGRVICVMEGGKIDLIGKRPNYNWTMLNANASPGATQIVVENAVDWKVGDKIFITSTDYDFSQAEQKTITAISGTTITLNSPLSNYHHGTITRFNFTNKPGSDAPKEIDGRAEVGLLSHNILVQGGSDAATTNYGATIMVMEDQSVGRFQGVEVYRGGQFGITGRYPIHFHNVNDGSGAAASNGARGGSPSFVRGSSVHESYNRCYTIHKTNNISFTDNVGYNAIGHCYFIEDGKETGNILTHNIAASVKNGPLDDALAPGQGQAAAFWITNPNNDFIGNSAAGVQDYGRGFWYHIKPALPSGTISSDGGSYRPTEQPMGIFKNNRAHSINGFTGDAPAGIYVGGTIRVSYQGPKPIPGVAAARFEDFTSFALSAAIWTAGGNGPSEFIRARIANVQRGIRENILNNSLVANNDGRLADPCPASSMVSCSAIWSYEGNVHAYNSVFINFNTKDNPANPSSVFDHQQGGEFYSPDFFNNQQINSEMVVRNREKPAPNTQQIYDPNDTFGNGSGGTFYNADWDLSSVDSTCRSNQTAIKAKGIPDGPLGEGMYWCPRKLMIARISSRDSSFDTSIQSPGFKIRQIDQAGQPLSEFYPLAYLNLVGKDAIYELQPNSPLDMTKNYIQVGLMEAVKGDAVTFKVPWTGTTNAYALFANNETYPGPESRVTTLGSMEELRSSESSGFYLDTANESLYFKLVMKTNDRNNWRSSSVVGNNAENYYASIEITADTPWWPVAGKSGFGNFAFNPNLLTANVVNAFKNVLPKNTVSSQVVSSTPTVTTIFYRALKQGDEGADVKALQVYLNSQGSDLFKVSLSGDGSVGKETTYFGPATKRALIKWQQAYGLTANGMVDAATLEKLKDPSKLKKANVPATATSTVHWHGELPHQH